MLSAHIHCLWSLISTSLMKWRKKKRQRNNVKWFLGNHVDGHYVPFMFQLKCDCLWYVDPHSRIRIIGWNKSNAYTGRRGTTDIGSGKDWICAPCDWCARPVGQQCCTHTAACVSWQQPRFATRDQISDANKFWARMPAAQRTSVSACALNALWHQKYEQKRYTK